MNKIAIPALLLGVVMIAGAFAFMPVQEASTVHTSATNLANMDSIKTATSAVFTPTANQAAQAATVTINMNEPFELLQLTLTCESGATVLLCAAAEDMDIVSYAVDGSNTATVLTIVDQVGADAAGTTTVITLSANTGAGVGGAIAASDQIVINLELDTADGGGGDDGYTLTATATVRIASGTTFAQANVVVA